MIVVLGQTGIEEQKRRGPEPGHAFDGRSVYFHFAS
jgi:hypothetical protein